MEMIEVGELAARAGEKVIGSVAALETPVGAVRLPVVIINSGRAGPRLVLTAGIHGTEYPCVEAATRMARELTPSMITGSIVIFPLVNTVGFEATAVNTVPLDGHNLNRVFPGNPEGTASLALAHFLYTTVSTLADYVVDMHGGDASEWLDPFAICYESGNASVDARSLAMARLYDVRHIWVMNTQYGHRGTFVGELSKHGIPAVCGEAGYLGTCRDEEVQQHLRGVTNIMKHLGMRAGEPECRPADDQTWFRAGFELTAHRAGIFEPTGKPSQRVRKGDVLGRVRDLFGDTLETIVAPGNGVIRTLFPKRVIHSGSIVYRGWLDEVRS